MGNTVSSLQKAEREIIIDFSIDQVKSAIMTLFEKFPSKYMLRKNDINEVFNTYHFPVSNNLNPAIFDITLEAIDLNKTKIKVTVTNVGGSISSNSVLSGMLSDYLLVLSKVLSGDNMESIKETVKNSGCMVLILVGILSLTIMSFMFI